jgi:glycosyltransferase involved in cell wall biosynthesis
MASLAHAAEGVTYEVVVVDNGSDDETLSFVGSHTPGQLRGGAQGPYPPKAVRLVKNDVRRALARSWNMGFDAAAGRHVIISNNDVIYAPGSLREMVYAAESSDQVGIVLPLSPLDITTAKPRLLDPSSGPEAMAENIEEVARWDAARSKIPNDVMPVRHPYIMQGGYVFLLKRDCWNVVGRFDEEYDLTGEDYDYFSRTLRWRKIVQARRAYVEHFERQTRMWLGDEEHEHVMRNRFRLAEKRDGQIEMFSVVIPNYNRIEALIAALDSLEHQTFPHWKAYVIDDGSPDWDRIQKGVADRFGWDAGRVWFLHRPKNLGPSAARNYGLRLTRGKYVAFLDSDDVWKPNHLQRHWDVHEVGKYAAVYSNPEFAWRWYDADQRKFLYRPDKHPTITYWGPFDKERLKAFNYIQTSSLSVWGPLARALEFPEGMHVEEDWEYCKRIAEHGDIYHLDEITCRYHISRNPEQEHLISRVVSFETTEASWETRRLVVIPHQLSESAKLSVVIPTKDRAGLLGRAIESCIIYPDTPVCVVDDGSEDAESVRKVVNEALLGCLLRSQESKGPSWARNRGVEYMPSEWIQFLDDDDILTADWGSRLAVHLTDDWDVILAQALVPDMMGGFRATDDVFTSQVAVRRSAFLNVGGFKEDLWWAEERDLVDRMKTWGARIKYIKTPLVIRPAIGGSGKPETAQKNEPCNDCGPVVFRPSAARDKPQSKRPARPGF